jgi:hypothetical protein
MCDLFGTEEAARKDAAKAAKAEAETKAREAKRQADIKTGNANIDSAFSQYSPEYYQKFTGTYQDNYNPQIDKQHEGAVGRMTAALAGRGMLDSSVGAAKFGEAETARNDARLKVAGDAQVAAGDIKQKVAARKSDLYSLNQAAADPEGIAAQAVGASTALTGQPATSPLGDIFASVLAPLNAYQSARQNSAGPAYSYKPASSGKVVR